MCVFVCVCVSGVILWLILFHSPPTIRAVVYDFWWCLQCSSNPTRMRHKVVWYPITIYPPPFLPSASSAPSFVPCALNRTISEVDEWFSMYHNFTFASFALPLQLLSLDVQRTPAFFFISFLSSIAHVEDSNGSSLLLYPSRRLSCIDGPNGCIISHMYCCGCSCELYSIVFIINQRGLYSIFPFSM